MIGEKFLGLFTLDDLTQGSVALAAMIFTKTAKRSMP